MIKGDDVYEKNTQKQKPKKGERERGKQILCG